MTMISRPFGGLSGLVEIVKRKHIINWFISKNTT